MFFMAPDSCNALKVTIPGEEEELYLSHGGEIDKITVGKEWKTVH